MKNLLSHGLVMATAVFVTLPANSPSANPVIQRELKTDPRLVQLREFFANSGCPVEELAEDFLIEADEHDLDWRLLPSIAIVESGGGKQSRNNNVFGWDSGNTSFQSVQAGIHHVASRLAISDLYRDKDVDDILRTYNPRPGYIRRVKSVMARLSPPDESLD